MTTWTICRPTARFCIEYMLWKKQISGSFLEIRKGCRCRFYIGVFQIDLFNSFSFDHLAGSLFHAG